MNKYLILLLLLAGCNTESKTLHKTQLYLFEHPEFSAGYCAEQYPVKDSVVARDSISFDTLYMDQVPDTSYQYLSGDTVFITKYQTKYITKTIRKDSIIFRRDAAEEIRLNLSLQDFQKNNNDLLAKYNKLEEERNEWKGKAKTRFWWILLLIGGGIVFTFFKLKNNLPFFK